MAQEQYFNKVHESKDTFKPDIFGDCKQFTDNMIQKCGESAILQESVDVKKVIFSVNEEISELKEAKEEYEKIDAIIDTIYYLGQHLTTIHNNNGHRLKLYNIWRIIHDSFLDTIKDEETTFSDWLSLRNKVVVPDEYIKLEISNQWITDDVGIDTNTSKDVFKDLELINEILLKRLGDSCLFGSINTDHVETLISKEIKNLEAATEEHERIKSIMMMIYDLCQHLTSIKLPNGNMMRPQNMWVYLQMANMTKFLDGYGYLDNKGIWRKNKDKFVAPDKSIEMELLFQSSP